MDDKRKIKKKRKAESFELLHVPSPSSDDAFQEYDFQDSVNKEKQKLSVTANDETESTNENEQEDCVDDELSPKKSRRKKRRKKIHGRTEARVTYGIEPPEDASFSNFNLDERLLKAVAALGWERPTQVQQNMIPIALEGKNITARARTGSGKTAAYMLPVIQKILQLMSINVSEGPYALFIAPSKELARQVANLLKELTSTFPFLHCINFSETDFANDEVSIKEKPDMVVSTPTHLLRALRKNPELCKRVRHVVLDEADLLLSYGHEADMRQIKTFLPEQHQTIFTSATLSEDVGALKNLFMNGPVVALKLKEGQLPDTDQLSQYHIYCQNDDERFAILLSMIKLKLIIGKSIIFVSDTDRCYQLGLFLQAFHVRSCILNAQMPVNSRCHIVEEFNQGRYDYVIASDISDMMSETAEDQGPKVDSSGETSMVRHSAKKTRRKFDKESGVSRGIDFHHVSNVINFDFPTSVDSYIHRVGRTARGWNKGTALSFASPEERHYLEDVQSEINTQMGRAVIVPYEIRIRELESFVLRAREALNACTNTAVKEARLAEIKAELLRSKRLEGYFIKNPREKAALEHDKKLHTLSLHSPAIAGVQDYMVPVSLRGMNYEKETQIRKKRGQRQRQKQRLTSGQIKYKKKMDDPLQSFTV